MRIAIIALSCICLILLLFLLKTRSMKKVGCIRINTSDPDKDVYTLELDIPFGELDQHDKVVFDIVHE